MRKIVFLILLCGFQTGVIAQNSNNFQAIDNKMLQIPESATTSTQDIAGYINKNFSNSNDKSRAIFIWIAKNIQYDFANMFKLKNDLNTDESIEKTLQTRKGICNDYANLFNDIAGKVGIKSYVIAGYTKQNGVVDKIPHAWCAADIDARWYLFDPTWGSGYVQDSKFVKEVNDIYFKRTPEQSILTHMPFDPIWQFLNYPFTNQEFYEGRKQEDKKPQFFSFTDSLVMYDTQSDIERLINSNRRIKSNGVKNSMIADMLQYNERNLKVYDINQNVDQFNAAGNTFNTGVTLLNNFIKYRNKQFKPEMTDSEIQQMMDSVESTLKMAMTQLNNIKNLDSNGYTMKRQLQKSIEEATASLNGHKAFVQKYLSTEKKDRIALFYK